MKTTLFAAVFTLIGCAGAFAQEFTRDLRAFNRIVVSPHINLILEQGDEETVRMVHGDVPSHKINVEVQNRTLRIYLDDARVTDKLEREGRHYRRSAYRDASITAYVTYRDLERLEVRGAQEVTCLTPISSSRRFKLKAYGENEITLSAVNTDYFKASLYGENRLKVRGGKTDFQKYKLYGENRVDASRMKTYATSATSFGESHVKVFSQDEVRVTAFGETRVSYSGDAMLSKGLILGKSDISRNN